MASIRAKPRMILFVTCDVSESRLHARCSIEAEFLSSIKPLDEEAVVCAARETGCIAMAENHNTFGGLGSAVAEVVTTHCPVPVVRVGIRDTFGEVGTPEWLAEKFSIGAVHIANAAREALDRK